VGLISFPTETKGGWNLKVGRSDCRPGYFPFLHHPSRLAIACNKSCSSLLFLAVLQVLGAETSFATDSSAPELQCISKMPMVQFSGSERITGTFQLENSAKLIVTTQQLFIVSSTGEAHILDSNSGKAGKAEYIVAQRSDNDAYVVTRQKLYKVEDAVLKPLTPDSGKWGGIKDVKFLGTDIVLVNTERMGWLRLMDGQLAPPFDAGKYGRALTLAQEFNGSTLLLTDKGWVMRSTQTQHDSGFAVAFIPSDQGAASEISTNQYGVSPFSVRINQQWYYASETQLTPFPPKANTAASLKSGGPLFPVHILILPKNQMYYEDVFGDSRVSRRLLELPNYHSGTWFLDETAPQGGGADETLPNSLDDVLPLAKDRILFQSDEIWWGMFGTDVRPLFGAAESPPKMRIWPMPYSGRILFTGDKGWFELEGSTLTKLSRDPDLGEKVILIVESRSPGDPALFILTDKGLYSLVEKKATLLATETELDAAMAMLKAGKSASGSDNASVSIDRRVSITKLTDGRVIIFTAKGALAIYRGTITPVASVGDYGTVFAIFPAGPKSDYLYTDRGVFQLTGDRLFKLASSDQLMEDSTFNSVVLLQFAPDAYAIALKSGLHRILRVDLTKITQDFNISDPVVSKNSIVLPIEVKSQCSSGWWGLTNPELRITVEGDSFHPTFRSVTLEPAPRENAMKTLLRSEVAFSTKSRYGLTLVIHPTNRDDTLVVGQETSILPSYSLLDWLGARWKWLTIFLLIAHSLSYIALIFHARRSARSFQILFDPIWDKLSLWFYAALRYSRKVQLFLFQSYIIRLSKSASKIPTNYVPMPLSSATEELTKPEVLLDKLKTTKQIWVQGNSGMGKTALVQALKSACLGSSKRSSAKSIWDRYHFVPVFVAARSYSGLASRPEDPSWWLREATRQSLSALGMEFPDQALFSAILNSGLIAVVLDGANEVDRDDQIRYLANNSPLVPLLVTSQTLPNDKVFETFRLPPDIGEYVELLLWRELGEKTGVSIVADLKATGLFYELRSGYDVMLITDLIHAGVSGSDLPVSRLDLYGAMLSRLRMPDDKELFPVHEITELGWRVWLSGERELKRGVHVREKLVGPLTSEPGRILNPAGGGLFEFRHDQMRAFLAARWLRDQFVTIEGVIQFLKGKKEIGEIKREDQEVVWGFLAHMLRSLGDIETLFNYVMNEPTMGWLQNALIREARARGTELIGIPRPPSD
jgi:hypothetical protein